MVLRVVVEVVLVVVGLFVEKNLSVVVVSSIFRFIVISSSTFWLIFGLLFSFSFDFVSCYHESHLCYPTYLSSLSIFAWDRC